MYVLQVVFYDSASIIPYEYISPPRFPGEKLWVNPFGRRTNDHA